MRARAKLVEIERMVGDVESRKIILRALLDGPKSGVELRLALARAFNKSVDEISDAMVYFNLQVLEKAGIIKRWRGHEDWKVKYAEIVPEKIQQIRRFFGIKVPVMCFAGLSDPLYIRYLRKIFREHMDVALECYKFFAPAGMRGRIVGIPEGVEVYYFDENLTFEELYERIRGLTEKFIREYEIMFDLSEGPRELAIIFCRLALEFDLKAFYVEKLDEESGRIIWIIE
ncbi:MAG: helix-turn-helix domain-containing protein [Candidatus Baldrarchaeia archaeon]